MKDNNDVYCTITEASEVLGVSYRALRYYEEKFKLQVNRDVKGRRVYSKHNFKILKKIIAFRKKGVLTEGIKSFFQENGITDADNYANINLLDNELLQEEAEDQEVVQTSDIATVKTKEILVNEIKDILSQEMREQKEFFIESLEKLQKENTKLKEEFKIKNDELRDALKNHTDESILELKKENANLKEEFKIKNDELRDNLKNHTDESVWELKEKNIELKQAINQLQRNNDEHYQRIDEKISKWREENKIEKKETGFFSKLFGKRKSH